jgi:acyl carrier protein
MEIENSGHSTETECRIRDYIVENILFGAGQRCLPDTPFQEGGILDSTGVLEVITFVEESFGIEIADSEVVPENLGSLRKISRFVDRKLGEKATTSAAGPALSLEGPMNNGVTPQL